METLSAFSKLPNEIISLIISLGFEDEFDYLYLWATLRNVNHRIRYLVEEFVRRNHLKKTFITYIFKNPTLDWGSEEFYKKLWLSCKGFDGNDQSIVVFKINQSMSDDLGEQGWLELLEDKLKDCPLDAFAYPPHIVSSLRFVNDTELVDFDLVIEDNQNDIFEIRFDWKATISKLLAEERLRQTMSKRWVCESLNDRYFMLTLC
jgi:hypothetical protein